VANPAVHLYPDQLEFGAWGERGRKNFQGFFDSVDFRAPPAADSDYAFLHVVHELFR